MEKDSVERRLEEWIAGSRSPVFFRTGLYVVTFLCGCLSGYVLARLF